MLEEEPEAINAKFSERYPEFVAFRQKSGKAVKTKPQTVADEEVAERTPVEEMEAAYQTVRNSLATELLRQKKTARQVSSRTWSWRCW